jgi:hypothetical protein
MIHAGFANVRSTLKRNIQGLTHLDDAQQAALLEREFLFCLIEGDHPELLQDQNWLRHRILPRGDAWDETIRRCKQMAEEYRDSNITVPDVEIERFDATLPAQPETEEEIQQQESMKDSRSWALRRGLQDSF